MSDSLRQSFERMMESMFLNPDWKNVVPIRQQLEFEDVFMGAAQTVFLEIVKSNGQCVPDLDNQLREFGQRIVTRYEEAGIDHQLFLFLHGALHLLRQLGTGEVIVRGG